jgi:HD-GYP domain-containing protein (c-di-GMP phosphodiesterase class II)
MPISEKSRKNLVMSSLRAVMHAASDESRDHCSRIAELCRCLGKRLELSDGQLDDLILLAVLHDIGKIRIDDRILSKDSPLTDWEWDEIQKHPVFGFQIVQAVPDFRHIADGILFHHEWWDGSGYPYGLAGEAIPYCSRVLAVVDAYDAMTHDRSYHKALARESALSAIRLGAGRQFDPYLAGIFLDLME